MSQKSHDSTVTDSLSDPTTAWASGFDAEEEGEDYNLRDFTLNDLPHGI